MNRSTWYGLIALLCLLCLSYVMGTALSR